MKIKADHEKRKLQKEKLRREKLQKAENKKFEKADYTFDYEGKLIKVDKKQYKEKLGNLFLHPAGRADKQIFIEKPNLKKRGKLNKEIGLREKVQNFVKKRQIIDAFRVSNSLVRRSLMMRPGRKIKTVSRKMLLDSFSLKPGVTLKSDKYFLRSKKKIADFVDGEGRRRISKKTYERIKKKGRRSISENVNVTKYKRNSEHREKLMMIAKKQQESEKNSRASSVKSEKRLNVNYGTYEKFIKEISKTEKKRKYSYGWEMSEMSQQSEVKAEMEKEKIFLINQKKMYNDNVKRVRNEPVDESFTYKNLKEFANVFELRKKKLKKKKIVRPRDKATSFSKSFGVGLTTTATGLDMSNFHIN
jgi:hypothetical protein